MASDLAAVLAEARACRICVETLPHEPRPVLRAAASARLMIIGQAPGTKVHASGVPWDDASGERLRAWLQMSPEVFYDETRVAILPMGLCFPGQDAKGGDLPPIKICAPTWHPRVLAGLADLRLTLLVGGYAQKRYLGKSAKGSLTETVRAWRDYGPEHLPLPHPSWRNTAWLKKNPWFETELLTDLRHRVSEALD